MLGFCLYSLRCEDIVLHHRIQGVFYDGVKFISSQTLSVCDEPSLICVGQFEESGSALGNV
jgi:hypothetical protein